MKKMARANRHFLSGYAWHLNHRRHKREFLLEFAKDKEKWKYWLFEAKKRFGLCVLNFTIYWQNGPEHYLDSNMSLEESF